MSSISFKDLKDPVVLVAVGFGSGLSPWAPGTAGTILAAIIYYFVHTLSLDYYIVFTLIITVIGILSSGYTVSKFNVHDHPAIVIDEIAGFLVTMLAVPFSLQWVLIGFLLFRFFDILKPWPISWLDRHVKGGFGVMLDDLLAGVMSGLLIHGYLLVSG